MGEKKLRAKLTKELGREPTADELTTASKLLKAKKGSRPPRTHL
jgi:hypothetical protein